MPCPSRTRLAASAAALGASVLLVSCGGGGSDADVRIDGLDIRYDRDVYEAQAGPATIEFRNRGSIQHNVVFEETAGAPTAAGDQEFFLPGTTTKWQVDLAPGEYSFFCSVPGHREAGMVGTLVVS